MKHLLYTGLFPDRSPFSHAAGAQIGVHQVTGAGFSMSMFREYTQIRPNFISAAVSVFSNDQPARHRNRHLLRQQTIQRKYIT
jgi:hypothetical protein